MQVTIPFGEVVEAVDQLSLDEQETLLAIMHRRLVERGRQRVVAAVQESLKEYQEGKCRAVTPDELMEEILS